MAYIKLILGLVLCVAVSTVNGDFSGEDLFVDAGDLGRIEGINANTILSNRPYIKFLGIPYASPPTGSKRFLRADPLQTPLRPPGQAFPATSSKNCCAQNAKYLLCPTIKKQEDCLFLNVYTPRAQGSSARLLPVIFFIHGGAFTTGSGDMYTGDRFLERDVVVVSFNYRLGVFGFFNLNVDDAPGNAAMYDMVDALTWVKNYISYFGGDPNLVTIMGQSAGSVSVTQLLLSPLTRDKNLFHRAIAMSGSALHDWGTTTSVRSEDASKEMARRVGCYDPNSNYNPNMVISCMRNVPMNDLVRMYDDYQNEENNQGRLGFDPVTPTVQVAGGNERFLVETPSAILESHREANVPLLMGATRHDGSFVLGIFYNSFLKYNGLVANETYLRNGVVPQMLSALGIQDETDGVFDAVAHFYLNPYRMTSGNFTIMIPGLTDMFTTFFFQAASYRTVKLHSRVQRNTYWYLFNYKGEDSVYAALLNTTDNPVRGGVAHGDDLIYLFNIIFQFVDKEEEINLSNRMVNYWVNFAYSGNPNTATRVGRDSVRADDIWKPYVETAPHFAVLDVNDTFVDAYPNDFWQNVADDLWPELPPPPECPSRASRK